VNRYSDQRRLAKAEKGSHAMTNATLRGKPDAGNPHVRFDEGEVAPAKPRRGSLLYRSCRHIIGVIGVSLVSLFAMGAESPATVVYMSGARNLRWMTAKERAPELRWVNPSGTDRTVLTIAGHETQSVELPSGVDGYVWVIADPAAETIEEDVYTLSLVHYDGQSVLSSNACEVAVVNGIFTPTTIDFAAGTSGQSRGWTSVMRKRIPVPCDSQWSKSSDVDATGTLTFVHKAVQRNFDLASSSWQLLVPCPANGVV
jgi:hypothetical protein